MDDGTTIHAPYETRDELRHALGVFAAAVRKAREARRRRALSHQVAELERRTQAPGTSRQESAR